MRILLVDDEVSLVKGIKFNLENEGYKVDFCYDGECALQKARSQSYDLILLDVMMPKLDGVSACQEIRKFSNVPIVMLTAKSEDADKLMGFESGADDYILKPFNILELKARIRAILRRSQALESRQYDILELKDLKIDLKKRRLLKSDSEIELTMREFDLLVFLMKNPGQVFSRDSLLTQVWGYDYMGDVRTVDVHIRRLREKLEENPGAPVYIQTKWGVGYFLAE